jgi:CcmD family protein
MNKFQKVLCVLLLTVVSAAVNAQTTVNAENADMMRSNGKIYVVVAVVLTVLLGLFFYVFNLDRKISKLEKK